MRRNGRDRQWRRLAIAGVAVAASALLGVGTAEWTMAEASSFYAYPIDRGPPLYARQRPVEVSTPLDGDPFGYSAAGYSAAAGSTATSVQPEYFSASGS